MDNKNDENDSVLIAAVEGGGTTFVVCVARLYSEQKKDLRQSSTIESSTTSSSSSIDLSEERIKVLETTSISSSGRPEQTLDRCCAWLSARRPDGGRSSYGALGVACFGPLGLNTTNTTTYGHILASSPKQEWRGVDVLSPLLEACRGNGRGSNDGDGSSPSSSSSPPPPPHLLDTDVNAPAVAEFERRQQQQQQQQQQSSLLSSLAYVTVGTGIGVGLVVNSQPVHGRMHPEGGHICVAPLLHDTFQGYSWGKQTSPYGGRHTVEGIASSVALTERVASRRNDHDDEHDHDINRDDLALLDDDDEVWDHAANALANLCVSLVLLLSMEEIVLGGGIMKRTVLFGKIRSRVRELLCNYVDVPNDNENENSESPLFIRPATWGNSSGLVGALVLSKKAYTRNNHPTHTTNKT